MMSYLVCESRNRRVVITPFLLLRALAAMNLWAVFENVILQIGQVQREVRLTICTDIGSLKKMETKEKGAVSSQQF